MRLLTVALWCLPAAVGLFARNADACSGCAVPDFAPQKPLPSNLLALPPLQQLTRSDGGEVSFVPTTNGVQPTEPLQVGETYLMSGNFPCGQLGEHTFTAGPAVPLPERTGTVSVTHRGGDYDTPTISGSCFATIKADGARIELEPDPQLEPWLELTKAHVVVDGTEWASSSQFGTPWSTSQNFDRADMRERYAFDVYGSCGIVPSGAMGGFSQGHHQGVLFVHLAGMTGDVPGGVTFDFDVDCAHGCGCGTTSPATLLIAALLCLTRRGRRG